MVLINMHEFAGHASTPFIMQHVFADAAYRDRERVLRYRIERDATTNAGDTIHLICFYDFVAAPLELTTYCLRPRDISTYL